MRTVIFALVNEVFGPPGHGESGEPYLALATDSQFWWTLGSPHPLFTTEEAANRYKSEYRISATVKKLELRD